MNRHRGAHILAALLFMYGLSMVAVAQDRPPMRVTVSHKVLHEVSPLLFGHFVEHANWHGEAGIDIALTQGDRLAPRVMGLVDSLQPPTLRFPGGTLVCSTDWLDYINNPPAEAHERWGDPGVQMRYTFDAFLRDCETWGAQPVLVVNFKKALLGTERLKQCAQQAAGLVAYCNLPVDADAPESLLKWARLRAKNGRVEPYGVRYFQIGNEVWAYSKQAAEERGDAYPRWYAQCLRAYINAMREVDPEVILISDSASKPTNDVIRELVGDRLDYMSSHAYGPWAIREVRRDGKPVNPRSLTDADVWRAFVSLAYIDPMTGMSTFPLYLDADTSGYPIAATEWNWNGWWELTPPAGEPPYDLLDSFWAKGVGAAGFIHGLIRRGDKIKLAHQSMLIGKAWGITSVHIPPQGADHAYLLPSGAITGFYARHHGDRRLDARFDGVPMYNQPYKMGTLEPSERVALVDVVVTADDDDVFVHLISRSFETDTPIIVDFADLSVPDGPAVLHVLQGELKPELASKVPIQEDALEVRVIRNKVSLVLPARAVACLQIPRR